MADCYHNERKPIRMLYENKEKQTIGKIISIAVNTLVREHTIYASYQGKRYAQVRDGTKLVIQNRPGMGCPQVQVQRQYTQL